MYTRFDTSTFSLLNYDSICYINALYMPLWKLFLSTLKKCQDMTSSTDFHFLGFYSRFIQLGRVWSSREGTKSCGKSLRYGAGYDWSYHGSEGSVNGTAFENSRRCSFRGCCCWDRGLENASVTFWLLPRGRTPETMKQFVFYFYQKVLLVRWFG